MAEHTPEPLLEMFLFETAQLLGQLEQTILSSEEAGGYSEAEINEIFRIMHTIKGATALMMFDNLATLAHSIEDVFFYLREANPANIVCDKLSDLILAGVDFFKLELEKVKAGNAADGDISLLNTAMKEFLAALKTADGPIADKPVTGNAADNNSRSACHLPEIHVAGGQNLFKATVFFEEDCGMEDIRAYTMIQDLMNSAEEISHEPDQLMEEDAAADIIRRDGFKIIFRTDLTQQAMEDFFEQVIFLKSFTLTAADHTSPDQDAAPAGRIVLEDQLDASFCKQDPVLAHRNREAHGVERQSIISVNVNKLDMLMDLVGELVIAEAMVIQNPELRGLTLDNFGKAARQLEKITGELQDIVMSIRMVPLTTTFHKMQRIVRDMSKKLDKDVQLELVGGETEVDKNIIEHISDPLMHLMRNAIDHGIESGEERAAAGKPPAGQLILEARNDGSDVVILIKDDGRGLNREKILKRARENGLIHKPETELSDKEVYSFIFAPGFSTKDNVTEFSGRGVGMDVVSQNISSIGGTVLIDSTPGAGTTILLKIPLTLAIVTGMTIGVGKARYTIPITAVKESFKPTAANIITDPDGNEMIMVRGQCYPILRLHRIFRVDTPVVVFTDGIIIMVENDNNVFCLFADALLGEQQVVVKTLPAYIKGISRVEGLAGCTLLGDGSISLILDIGGLINRTKLLK